MFTKLLVECAKDFSLRSVPQVSVLPLGSLDETNDSATLTDEEVIKREKRNRACVHDVVILRRVRGGAWGVILEQPLVFCCTIWLTSFTKCPLLRCFSASHGSVFPDKHHTEARRLASRFQKMIGWENSDHPVVVFKSAGGAHSPDDISGIDILSLNRQQR